MWAVCGSDSAVYYYLDEEEHVNSKPFLTYGKLWPVTNKYRAQAAVLAATFKSSLVLIVCLL